jgi:signal transduction histidine kinase
MFKSVFAKYVTAFMMIIFVSFLVLSMVTAVAVNNYSMEEKKGIMSRSAISARDYIEGEVDKTGTSRFKWFVNNKRDDITTVLEAIAFNSEDITVVLADSNGEVLLAVGAKSEMIPQNAFISNALMDEINAGKEIMGYEKIDGIFDTPCFVNAVPVSKDTYVLGTVFIFSDSATVEDLVGVMIKIIVLASLWIMLAAFVAVYFISKKVISPLKNISDAAKKFASGQFDVRVDVKGKDEVAELATTFNNMAMSLDNYETMRNTFMANVSHDLRTPMTTISGFIDGILAGAIPPEKHEYYLGVIASEVRRLSRLVASLLDISRIQAGDRKFVMKSFDACEMARQILISFEQKIDAKHLDVEFECTEESMYVKADRDAIHQVLYNICDNAVKFSHERGKLAINLTYTREKKVEVSVYNEGIGIPAEDLPYVFERFFKSDKSRGVDKLGVGLGMYITKTIMEAHGETIKAESEHGKYCKFTLTLPRTDIIADEKNSNPKEEVI